MESKKTEEKKKLVFDEKDLRDPCKYADKCYQKNPEHHAKYKHPLKEENIANGNKRKKDEGDEADESQKLKSSKTESNHDENKTNSNNKIEDSNENIKDNDKSKNAENVKDNNKSKNEENVKDNNKSKNAENVKDNNKSKNAENVDTSLDSTQNKELIRINKLQDSLLASFLFKMPNDFFQLFDFCKELRPSDPLNALKGVDLQLIGPYDIITDNFSAEKNKETDFLTHWRYFYDPPEFQTILKGDSKSGLHYGYWRDSSNELPLFVVVNSSNVSCTIKPVSETIFGALDVYLEEKIKNTTPFERISCTNISTKIKAYTKKHNISLDRNSAKMKLRERKVVARTFHTAGIVVPFNKKNQLGYRELSVSNDELKKIVSEIDKDESEEQKSARSKLDEVIRLATIAGDECDFGTCLELAHDLFSSGVSKVQDAALGMFSLAYTQLERPQFLKIAEAHLKNRKKDCNKLSNLIK